MSTVKTLSLLFQDGGGLTPAAQRRRPPYRCRILMTTFRNPGTLRVAARQLAEAMQSDCPADRAFDQCLPER